VAAPVIRPLWWNPNVQPHGALEILDQTRLPTDTVTLTCSTLESVFEAIRNLRVRGAPAIGVAAAYGVLVGLIEFGPADHVWPEVLGKCCDYLATSRPTAVNLPWALDRMRAFGASLGRIPWADARVALLEEAHRIRNEDAAMCRAIGQHGQHLIPEGAGVLTHCNAGALATSEYGTALAVMYAALEHGRHFRAFVDETRPLLQGARLTAWELKRAGINTTVVCDSMAALLLRDHVVRVVIVGADRIAANGDVANKIGTYGLAVLAAAHNTPFYVAAPSSTFDLGMRDGSEIPIEFRDSGEVGAIGGRRTVPEGVDCWNPAFDVTPAKLVTGIVTERGVIHPVNERSIRATLR
jgi:methylthioribose-1-phosphate isomerase